MTDLLVRDVPEHLLRRLKDRARANGRSPEAEHLAILRQALSGDDGPCFETLAAQLRALTAGRRQTPAEDLLRHLRDSR
jgi:plasmid stability protein